MSGKSRYVLEAGNYIISINRDSHNIIDAQTYTMATDVDYSQGRSTDQTAPSNQFGFAVGDVTYLSRTDGFASYAQATAAPEYKAAFLNNSNYTPADYNDPNDVMPTTGGDADLELVQAIKDGKLSVSLLDQQVDELLDVILPVTKTIKQLEGKPFNIDAHHTMDVIGNFDLNVVGFEPGYPHSGKGDPTMQAKAVESAKKADIILLYIGLDEISESEGLDR